MTGDGRDENAGTLGGAPAKPAIRRATCDDRAGLEPLVRAYIDFYRQPQPRDEQLSGLLDLLCEQPEVGVQFVAERDGELVGFATVYLTYDTVAAARIAVMNDLFVAPDDRDQGLGRALLERSHAFARESGCVQLQWITAADNRRAQRLYDSVVPPSDWIMYELPC